MGEQPPPLPTHMSSDGREVWAWADALSRHTHRVNETRRLHAEIAQIGRVCGGCDKWLKSSLCPREHNVGGMSRGPSSGEFICRQFVESRSATERREDLRAQLAKLEDPDHG